MDKFEMTNYYILDELLKRINNGESVNIQDEEGNTALILAASFNKPNTVRKILMHSDIDINMKDRYEMTALSYASYHGNYDIVKELLKESEIDIMLKTNTGEIALDYAIGCNHTEIIALLQIYEYLKENREMFTQLGIDNSIVETVIAEDNCFEVNKQNIDSLIQQYSNNNSVSVVESDELQRRLLWKSLK